MIDYYEGESALELRFFHSCTDGTNAGIIHFNDEDFKQAINISAICAHKSAASILGYTHMSTHSHFVLACADKEQADDFAFSYKREYARYIWMKYNKRQIFKGIENTPKEIGDMFYLRNCLSYTFLNPVVAGIVKSPELYKWSSFNLYFRELFNNDFEKTVNSETGVFIKDLSFNTYKRLLHTRINLNSSHFMVNEEGLILPSSFVNYRMVEAVYGNRSQFYKSMALTNSAKEEARYVNRQYKYTDAEVMAECFTIANQRFGKQSITLLTKDEKISLLPALRKKTFASPKQLARILSMKHEEITALLGLVISDAN